MDSLLHELGKSIAPLAKLAEPELPELLLSSAPIVLLPGEPVFSLSAHSETKENIALCISVSERVLTKARHECLVTFVCTCF